MSTLEDIPVGLIVEYEADSSTALISDGIYKKTG